LLEGDRGQGKQGRDDDQNDEPMAGGELDGVGGKWYFGHGFLFINIGDFER